MLADQALQLTDELATASSPELCCDPELDGVQPQFLQSHDLGLGPGLVGEVLQGLPTPHPEGFGEHDRGGGRVGVDQCPTLRDPTLEDGGVDGIVLHAEHVPRRAGHQHTGRSIVDIGLKRLAEVQMCAQSAF